MSLNYASFKVIPIKRCDSGNTNKKSLLLFPCRCIHKLAVYWGSRKSFCFVFLVDSRNLLKYLPNCPKKLCITDAYAFHLRSSLLHGKMAHQARGYQVLLVICRTLLQPGIGMSSCVGHDKRDFHV